MLCRLEFRMNIVIVDVRQKDALICGYAGVYSSFVLDARRAAERFDVDIRDILVELGKRKAVGGQEGWIIEVASDLKNIK